MNHKVKKIKTISDLEHSSWAKKALDPQVQEKLFDQGEALLTKIGSNHPIIERLSRALTYFKKWKSGEIKLTAKDYAILGASLVYTICPLDIIPDAIPVIGLLDDMGVLALAMNFILNQHKFSEKEQEVENIVKNLPDYIIKDDFQYESLNSEVEALLKQENAQQNSNIIKHVNHLQELASDPLRRIIFTGSFNAGKSSLINAIINQDILPTDITPTTAVATTIMWGNSHNVYLQDPQGNITNPEVNSSQRIPFLDNPQKKGQILITVPSLILKERLSFVDTPGLGDSMKLNFSELSEAIAFVFVKDVSIGSFTKEEYNYLKDISEVITEDQLIIVLNKCDTCNFSDLDEIELNLKRTIRDIGFTQVNFVRTCAYPRSSMIYDLKKLKDLLIEKNKSSAQAIYNNKIQSSIEIIRQNIEQEKIRKKIDIQLSQQEYETRIQEMNSTFESRISAIKSISNKYKQDFQDKLTSFVNQYLLLETYQMIDSLPMTQETGFQIREFIRNQLINYLKQAIESRLKNSDLEFSSEILNTPSVYISKNVPDYAQYSKYILPSIALITFFPMGIFSWLTTVAAPTFFLDKMGVPNVIKDLITKLGPENERKSELKLILDSEIQSYVKNVSHEFNIKIDEYTQDRITEEKRAYNLIY